MSINVTDFFDKFCGSQFWNSNLTWYTDDPDLTPCFEKTILVWIPFIFFHIFLPLELYRIDRSRSKNIPWSWINISKMIVTVFLLLMDVAVWTFMALQGSNYPADNVGSLLQLYFYIFLMIVVLYNKIRGLRVSYLLFFTSLLMVLCQTPQMYSFLREYLNSGIEDVPVVVMNIVIYVLKWTFFIFQFFCDKPPIYMEYPHLERPSPEDSASIPSRLTYSWFTPLVQLGAKKALEVTDMFSLDHENTSMVIVPNFDKNWLASVEKANRPESYIQESSRAGFYRTVRPQASILLALCKTFWPYFLVGSLFRLCQDLIVFLNPQLLKLLIRFVSSEESLWKGCLFAALMLICSNLQTFFVTRAFLTMHFLGNRIATALTSVIYRKSLKLSNAARKQSTLGELVNLMAVDASSFQQMMGSINLIWSAPLQVILALYFLWGLLGPAALAGLGVLIMVIPLNGWLVRQTRLLRIAQMKHKDERIKTMNEVLSGVKVLKLYAWEPSFEEKISSIRQKEIGVMKTAAFYNSLSSFLFSMSPFLVALASFALFVLYDDNNILDAETAFVSLSLFNILKFPLQQLPQVLNSVVLASVSVKRLNKYLNNEELDPESVEHDSSERDAIVVENGTFSWDASEDSAVVLRNINVKVPAGALVAVVGTVGCGKSSLVSAILGEMDKLSGRIVTNGKIAYVPQQAWIQNTSLQHNITYFKEYDESTFRRVVGACALEQDIDILPGGEMTEIGEKGINLSGGQKQRVSLARAVYSNADVYLLDDPLSAVDAHVGKHIFENVIGPQGILRKKTRLLVTHGVTFLPYTNLIIVMKDGKVSESGTYKQLIENKGAFADFLMQYLEEAEGLEVENELGGIRDELLKDASLRDRFIRAISVKSEGADTLQRQTSKDAGTSTSKDQTKSSPQEGSNQPPKQENKKLIAMEESQTGNVKLSVFLYYFKAIGVLMGLSAILFVILYQGFLVSGNLWLSRWSSDKSTVVNGTQDTSKTHLYLSVYAALGVGQAVCSVVSSLCLSLGCLFAAAWLHATMLHRILRAPMSYFDTTPLGRIVNRFSKDIDTCDTILSFNLSAFFNLAVQVFATVAVITYSTPVFIIVIIPIMIFNLLLQRYFVATSRQLKRLESTSRSPIYSQFGETVQGASSIRAYNMQEVFISQSEQKVDFNQACYYSSLLASRWLAIRLELVSNMLVFFAALFAVLYRDSLEAGLAGLSISYALQVTGMLNFFVRTAADVETNIVAVERIKEYTEVDQEAAWSVQPKPSSQWPQRGKLEFEDYRVRYREGLDLVLSGISFKILPSEKVGIVGRTGAGKSSLTLALFRILEAAGGAIFIDGVNIGSIGLHDLRSCITIIPQDPVLFSGTLRSNLDPFGKETDGTLWKALELSNLKPFVKSLPAGLNHMISEGGENLSVGQKQLICLSRALLRKTKVLVLDEATAAVDLETDDVIQRTIRTEFQDCTVLTIAHRLNTIMDYNRILVLDKGKVKEFDTPNALVQNPNTIFYSMAKDAGLVS